MVPFGNDLPESEMVDDIVIFVAVARRGSFTAAARELNVPLSTVSRRLAGLEGRLGERLLERTTRRLRLTAAGRQLMDRTEAPIDELLGVLRTGVRSSGKIRATAPPLAARTRLGAGLLAFLAEHEGVQLDLIATNALLDFIKDDIDIAFRIGPLEESSLVAVRLWSVPYMVCAAPRLADRLHAEGPVDIDRLSTTPCIWTGQAWQFEGRPGFCPSNIVHRIDELDLAAAAVEAGLGVAYLPADLARAVGVGLALAGLTPQDKTMYAVYPARRLLSARISELIAFLRAFAPVRAGRGGSTKPLS